MLDAFVSGNYQITVQCNNSWSIGTGRVLLRIGWMWLSRFRSLGLTWSEKFIRPRWMKCCRILVLSRVELQQCVDDFMFLFCIYKHINRCVCVCVWLPLMGVSVSLPASRSPDRSSSSEWPQGNLEWLVHRLYSLHIWNAQSDITYSARTGIIEQQWNPETEILTPGQMRTSLSQAETFFSNL